MLSLNIIPSELKKEIEFRNLSRSTKIILYSVTFSVIFYAAALFGCYLYLKSYYSDISSQNVIITKNTDNYNKQVKDINKQIKNIEDMQKDNFAWTDIIKDLFNNLSDNITLNKADFYKKDGRIIIAGIADSREDLVALRKYFENNSNFSLISFPVQNLVEKENINFEIHLQIKALQTDNAKKI